MEKGVAGCWSRRIPDVANGARVLIESWKFMLAPGAVSGLVVKMTLKAVSVGFFFFGPISGWQVEGVPGGKEVLFLVAAGGASSASLALGGAVAAAGLIGLEVDDVNH